MLAKTTKKLLNPHPGQGCAIPSKKIPLLHVLNQLLFVVADVAIPRKHLIKASLHSDSQHPDVLKARHAATQAIMEYHHERAVLCFEHPLAPPDFIERKSESHLEQCPKDFSNAHQPDSDAKAWRNHPKLPAVSQGENGGHLLVVANPNVLGDLIDEAEVVRH